MTSSYLAQEAIKPQFDRSFQKDVTLDLETICVALRGHKSSHVLADKSTTLLETFKSLKKGERDKLFGPLRSTIAKHTGLHVDKITGNTNTNKGHYVLIPLFAMQSHFDKKLAQLIKSRKASLKLKQNMISTMVLASANHHDPKSGMIKFFGGIKPSLTLVFNMLDIDKVATDRKHLAGAVAAVLHECGHLNDIFESIGRKATYSIVTENILETAEESKTSKEAKEALEYYYHLFKELHLKSHLVDSAVEDSIKKLLDAKDISETHYKELCITFTSILSNAINQSIGKEDDFSRTDSHYKNIERKADRYAVAQGAGVELIDHLVDGFGDITDLSLLSYFKDESKLKRAMLVWGMGYKERSTYDSLFRRVERILQEYYRISRDVFDEDKKTKRDLVDTIERCRVTVRRMEKIKDKVMPDPGFFHKLGNFFKNLLGKEPERKKQDTYMENVLHNTVSTPMFHEANKLMNH